MLYLGPLLDLPAWIVPLLPAAGFEPVPPLALTAVAAALTAVGAVAFRRRDVPA